MTPLEFRTKLVSQIIEKYGEDTENDRCGGRSSTVDNPFRLPEHFPSYIPLKNATKQCVVCKKRGVRKEILNNNI